MSFLNLLKGLVKTRILPYKPLRISKVVWNQQFSNGHWDYLKNNEEVARYGVIISLISHYFGNEVSILDLGCGTGIICEKLDQKYSYYTGVDLSDEAIKQASEKSNKKTEFLAEDLLKYIPTRKYDIVVFNESLYYFEKPLELLKKFSDFLNNGMIIISMWDNKERNNKIWKTIDKTFTPKDQIFLSHHAGKGWFIKTYFINGKNA
jgi:2-polyprenyl-6-hydroxyphenyl methylase/3-demethylubiquinone-9 3-methyltransferase